MREERTGGRKNKLNNSSHSIPSQLCRQYHSKTHTWLVKDLFTVHVTHSLCLKRKWSWINQQIPGSTQSIQGYILNYSRLQKGVLLIARGSQQGRLYFLYLWYPTMGRKEEWKRGGRKGKNEERFFLSLGNKASLWSILPTTLAILLFYLQH